MNGSDRVKRKDILAFIALFADGKRMFMNGLCYWFAFVLQERFGWRGIIVYEPIRGHFMWVYKNKAYDAEGEHDVPENAKTLSDIDKHDTALFERLIRDCVKITGGDERE